MIKLILMALAIIVLMTISAVAAEPTPVDWKLRALTAEAQLQEARVNLAIWKEKSNAVNNHLAALMREGSKRNTEPALKALIAYQKEIEAKKASEKLIENN